MKTFSIIVSVACLVVSAYGYRTEIPEEIAVQLQALRGPGSGSRMLGLPEEEKQRLIPWLRKEAQADELNRDSYEDDLLFLGDKQVLRKRATAWLGGYQQAGTFLRILRDPEVIGLIANGMFQPDPPPPGMGSGIGGRPGVSYETASIILEAFATTPGFRSELYDWAQRSYRNLPGPYVIENRDIMREWWKANERFFREQNYAAVQPGREMRDALAEMAAARAPAPAPASAIPAPPISTPALVPTTPVAVATQSSAPLTALLVTVTAAAVALLAGLLFFCKRRA